MIKLLERKIDYKWKYWHDKTEKDNYSVSVDDNNNTITIPLKKGWSDNKDACMPVDENDTVILCRLD